MDPSASRAAPCWPALPCASTRRCAIWLAWGLATPAEAIRMAAANPAALIGPALAARGIGLAEGRVTWSPALVPQQVRVGGMELRIG